GGRPPDQRGLRRGLRLQRRGAVSRHGRGTQFAEVRHWLQKLLVWMYQHPYEHDQKAFSAFLRAGERVAFEEELTVRPEEMPRWGFLDPETEFVSARHVDVAGWFGDADRIVAFHMLHGDSDESHASRQFAARNSLGVGYTDLL
ncbi:unnamed protein product, partial [Effrenium voratum]